MGGAITGLTVAEIEAFAALVGTTQQARFFRLGYGFARQRNGAVSMHAALCVPTVTGAWQHEGGGAFHSNSGIYKWRQEPDRGARRASTRSVRQLDQSQIGRVLTGDAEALRHGGRRSRRCSSRTPTRSRSRPSRSWSSRVSPATTCSPCVHEQFMTETAQMADIVLPATQFMEHDDIYQGGGHQHIMSGGKLIEPPASAAPTMR